MTILTSSPIITESIKDSSKEQILNTKTKFGIVKQYYRPLNFYEQELAKTNLKISKLFKFPVRNPKFIIIESKS